MPRLLIVDDEPAIAETLSYVLQSEGHAVEHVLTAQAALERLHSADYALAIVDVGLPDLSGFELMRRLRERSQMPVIFLTARSEEIDRVLGFELGADDYVPKPFSPREVAGRVRAILRRSASPPSDGATATPAGFSHEPDAARIRFKGRELELTRFEYGLLAYLIARPGHVVSRERLLDAVWGQDRDSTDRTVDTHVKTLRAKLREIDPDCDPIRTHRGMGYSLQP